TVFLLLPSVFNALVEPMDALPLPPLLRPLSRLELAVLRLLRNEPYLDVYGELQIDRPNEPPAPALEQSELIESDSEPFTSEPTPAPSTGECILSGGGGGTPAPPNIGGGGGGPTPLYAFSIGGGGGG